MPIHVHPDNDPEDLAGQKADQAAEQHMIIDPLPFTHPELAAELAAFLPKSYGGCTCACHRRSGIKHVLPCCLPSDEKGKDRQGDFVGAQMTIMARELEDVRRERDHLAAEVRRLHSEVGVLSAMMHPDEAKPRGDGTWLGERACWSVETNQLRSQFAAVAKERDEARAARVEAANLAHQYRDERDAARIQWGHELRKVNEQAATLTSVTRERDAAREDATKLYELRRTLEGKAAELTKERDAAVKVAEELRSASASGAGEKTSLYNDAIAERNLMRKERDEARKLLTAATQERDAARNSHGIMEDHAKALERDLNRAREECSRLNKSATARHDELFEVWKYLNDAYLAVAESNVAGTCMDRAVMVVKRMHEFKRERDVAFTTRDAIKKERDRVNAEYEVADKLLNKYRDERDAAREEAKRFSKQYENIERVRQLLIQDANEVQRALLDGSVPFTSAAPGEPAAPRMCRLGERVRIAIKERDEFRVTLDNVLKEKGEVLAENRVLRKERDDARAETELLRAAKAGWKKRAVGEDPEWQTPKPAAAAGMTLSPELTKQLETACGGPERTLAEMSDILAFIICLYVDDPNRVIHWEKALTEWAALRYSVRDPASAMMELRGGQLLWLYIEYMKNQKLP